MREAPTPGSAGVADHVLVDAPRRGCRGCRRDGHTGNHTIPKGQPGAGQLRKGHTSNAVGRPNGRPNDKTLLATQELRAHAHEAARVFIEGMRDKKNDWIGIGCAKVILERTLPRDPNAEPPDMSWCEYATTEEMEEVAAIIARAKSRMPVNDGPLDEPLDATLEKPDAFSLSSLPQPQEYQPEPPPLGAPTHGGDDEDDDDEDDDEEEFPTS